MAMPLKNVISGKILLKPVLSQAMNQTRYSDRRFFFMANSSIKLGLKDIQLLPLYRIPYVHISVIRPTARSFEYSKSAGVQFIKIVGPLSSL
jgi:hypothetical protein